MTVAAYILLAGAPLLAGDADRHESVVAGREAFDRWVWDYPWYDAEKDDLRSVEVAKPWYLVWEWVLDWYAPAYGSPSPVRNPQGPAKGKYKVIRGGSHNNNKSLVTCYTRDYARPDICAVNYGFRVRLSEQVFESNTGE